MKKQPGASWVLASVLVLLATGCEILVDFDRSKIDAGSGPVDASTSDVEAADSTGGQDAAGDLPDGADQ